MPPPSAPEHGIILSCLAKIRWRLWTVRLAERTTLALQWGAGVSLFLTASRLLRNSIPALETRPYSSAIIALIPASVSLYIIFKAANPTRTQAHLTKAHLTPNLLKITALLTILLSLAMAILTFLPIGAQIPVWAVPTTCVSLFVLLAATTVRMIDNRRAAIFVDHQVGLHERVSTALELLESQPNTTPSALEAHFHAPVIASAVQACQTVRTSSVGYRRLDPRLYATAAAIAIAAAGISLLTPLPARATIIRKPVAVQITNAKNLQAVFKELEEKKLPNDKVTPEKLKPLQTAINNLQQGTMSPIEASAQLNEAKEQMKRDQDAMQASDKVQEMLKAMSSTKEMAKAADDLKKAEMQKAEGDPSASANQKAAEEAIKNNAQAMADKMKAGNMSQGDKDKLASDLKSAADKAGSDPQLQKDLNDASNAAKNGDSEKLSQSMKDAAQRMGEQSANSQMSQGAMNRAMSEIDRMQQQSNAPGSQSTMGNPGGQQGQQGNPGDQANNGGQDGQNGQDGKDGQSGGKDGQGQGQPGNQPGGSQSAQGNGPTGGQHTQGQDSGSTMLESKGGPGGMDHGPIGGKESFVRIYDPTKTDSKGNQEKVGSFINPLGAAAGSMDVMGSADKNDSTLKTYQDALPDARQQAMDDLTRQEYPPQYQEMVRRFYEK